jgi:hypothetical protein
MVDIEVFVKDVRKLSYTQIIQFVNLPFDFPTITPVIFLNNL